METNYIYNVKTPIDSDKGVNKSYADTELSLSCGLMTGNLDIKSECTEKSSKIGKSWPQLKT